MLSSSLSQTYNLFVCSFSAPTFAVQALENGHASRNDER